MKRGRKPLEEDRRRRHLMSFWARDDEASWIADRARDATPTGTVAEYLRALVRADRSTGE